MHSQSGSDGRVVAPSSLTGAFVETWRGMEMALSEGTEVPSSASVPPIWSHPAVPYLQLISLDAKLRGGNVYRLLAQFPDGSGFEGLYLVKLTGLEPPMPGDARSIYRERVLTELPTGELRLVSEHKAPSGVMELTFDISGNAVRFLSGEVYERAAGTYEIVENDESILVQLNGARPRLPFGIAP